MYKTLTSFTSKVTSTESDAVHVGNSKTISVQAVYTNDTPAAKTFVDADVTVGSDTITIATHGFTTGLVGRLTTTGVLPAGLALATDYYIISVDANTIKLANSYANALAGTAVDITAAAGGGTHTFTATTLSVTIKLQSTVDGKNWADISGKTVAVTGAGSTIFALTDFAEPTFRIVLLHTSGVISVTTSAFIKL